ncbi:MAG: GGDEF domain-containing protein [Anaeroplasma sp.]
MNTEKLEKIDFFHGQNLQYAFDSLTKVLNREMITAYLAYLIQNKCPFTVALCDIDNFKNVNDNYGHMTGDEVLAIFADHIENSVGEKGVVGRYGGDEFMVILEGITEYNDVWCVFHTINVNASKLSFPNVDDLNVTLTTGISRYPLDASTYEELLETADKALYRGKKKGRNCFIIYLAAKHSKILLKSDKEKTFSSMDMLATIFKILTLDRSLKQNIESILQYFSSYLMLDHLCIESPNKVCKEIIHPLCKNNSFEFIPIDLFIKEMNGNGLFFVNNRRTLIQISSKDLHVELKNQSIMSSLAIKIECNDFTYGILRIDACNGRIWQSAEMDLFVVAARLIGLLLYKANTTLNDLFKESE